MTKKSVFSLLLLFSFFTFQSLQGCSSEQIRKSDSTSRITTLRETLDKLKTSYVAKDLEGFLSHVSPNMADRSRLRSELPAQFSRFKTVLLEFRIDHMVLEPSQGIVMVQWEGAWETDSAEPVRGSGTALFKFSDAPAPLLNEINGSSPFMLPVRGKSPDAPRN